MITPCPDITPEDVAVPWTLPLRPSRRSVLAGAAAAAGAALLTGCTDGDDPSGADSGIPLERRMREGAVRDSERLLERYDATAAAHPGLAGRLAPLRSAVAAHTAALAFTSPGTSAPSRPVSPSPSAAASPTASEARREAVPPQPEEALSALADAERSLSEARTIALAGAPGELARMLASVAACGAVHAYLLTSTPGAPA
ncbi:hypothetical protein OOK31_08980 [Streptomyces sp. NBC_00249]|uniref:hypothetical protein n=1 Tax=Streptomyces sp. NBC_00249 TaxID=2975690 RepID=UPI002255591F|nr:hypothetical protein [Streptomyces sp. NBC_00249]MCX5194028.1 hypothetical protein [Streptomyces sp. NBC_00249]